MTISTNYNPSSLRLQRCLASATNAMNKALSRMSTGYKINCAADDAAGLYVSTSMMTQLRGFTRAQKNTQDALSYMSTAESSLTNMTSLLNRIRDLSVQAANGVYGAEERSAMQAEADALTEQLYQIKNSTNFNGKNVFGAPETPMPKISRTFSASFGVSPINTNTATKSAGPTVRSVSNMASSIANANYNIKLDEDKALEAIKARTAPRAAKISGSVDFKAGETKDVDIDGVVYKIKNIRNALSTFSYSKDELTGTVTFISNSFTITSDKNKAHDIEVIGASNIIYGGDQNDKITISGGPTSRANTIYAGAGDDEIIGNGGSLIVHLQSGNNVVTVNTGAITAYGGTGNDTFNVYTDDSVIDCSLGGNNVFNIMKNNKPTLIGGDGDDTFNLAAGVQNAKIIGKGGVNTLNNLGSTNNIACDITTATGNAYQTAYSESFSANQTITKILADGKNYTIKNNEAKEKLMLYQIDATGRTNFIYGDRFTITANDNTGYKVGINTAYSTFYGTNQSDDIYVGGHTNSIYAGEGDDTINVPKHWNYIYAQSGNNTITSDGINSIIGGSGNDTIWLRNKDGYCTGGGGNNTIYIDADGAKVFGSNGNDKYIIQPGRTDVSIFGGTGTNTVEGNLSGLKFSSNLLPSDNASSVMLAAGETKTVTINGKDYTVKNTNIVEAAFGYSYNSVDGTTSFIGNKLEIKAQKDKEHNINLYADGSFFYGGDLNDKITNYGRGVQVYGGKGDDTLINANGDQSYFYGEDGNDKIIVDFSTDNVFGGNGDDEITINARCLVAFGDAGNDIFNINYGNMTISDTDGNNIFNINSSGNNITGGAGDDSFYVTGSNNTVIQGGAGDDFFEISGDSNKVMGGNGDNYYVVGGNTNTIQGGPNNNDLIIDTGIGNIKNNVTEDTGAGILNFTSVNQELSFIIDGKKYIVKNQNEDGTAPPTNMLRYYLNRNTGEVTMEGSNFTITSEADKTHNLVVKGSKNTVSGANLDDKITVASGSNNTINGLDGNDNIILNSANNKLHGGLGNDTITVNVSNGANIIDGGDGQDIININSDGNTNIQGGAGNDKININGDSNLVDGGLGNDNILAMGNNNTIIDIEGNNTLNASGDNNNLTGGAGKDVIGVNGKNNTINGGDGDNTITILGEQNNSTSGNGNDKITASGNYNNITSGAGNDEIVIKGQNNNASSIDGTNSFTVIGNANTVTGGNSKDTIVLSGNQNIAKGGDGNDAFHIRSGNENNIDGDVGDNTMINKGIDTIFTNVRDVTPNLEEMRFQVGANSGENSVIRVTTGFDIGDLMVDFSTAEDAKQAIENIDTVLNNLQNKASEFGAVINRLESAYEAQSTQIQNLTASRSTIMDADMAEESANFVKSQILMQTCSSLLTSSQNVQSSLILSLVKA